MKMPVIMRMVVVFPAPLRPSSPVMVPLRTLNETPSTARTSPNVFRISRTARMSAIPVLCLKRRVLYEGGRRGLLVRLGRHEVAVRVLLEIHDEVLHVSDMRCFHGAAMSLHNK